MDGTITAFGAFVGVVGVSIAIWLQMVARRRCPWYVVATFYGFGTFMLLLNSGALGAGENAETALGGLGLVVALLAETSGAVYAYRIYSEPRGEHSGEAWFDDLFGV